MNRGVSESAIECRVRAIAYARSVPPGAYTRNSAHRAQYNVLYACHLRHALGIDHEWVRGQLEELAASQLRDGFLPATEVLVGSQHSDDYLRLHKTALFLQLAEEYALDIRPVDISAVFPKDRLDRYLAALDWSNAWLHSNVLLGLATCADFARCRGGSTEPLERLAMFLMENVSAYGLWGFGRGASLLNAMAGTFHLVPILQCSARLVPHSSEMAHCIRRLQTPEGFFCAPTGYSCIEYDAAYLLHATFPVLAPAEQTAVRHAADQMVQAVAGLQNEDGGFPEIGRPNGWWCAVRSVAVPTWKHRNLATSWWNLKKLFRLALMRPRPFLNNSVRECAAGAYESNLFSTWFRLMALDLGHRTAFGESYLQLSSCRVVGLNYAPFHC